MAKLPRISLQNGEHITIDRDTSFNVDFWCDGELCWLWVNKYKDQDGYEPQWLRGWYISSFSGSQYIRDEVKSLLDFMTSNGNYGGMSPREMFIGLLGANDGR